MPGTVCVVASINVDLVVRVPHLPAPGETVTGGPFAVHEGGKGANQAVAAARGGAHVELIGAVGDDAHGRQARAALEREGIGVEGLRVHSTEPTGVALITVGPRGENQIAVAPGVNAALTLDDSDHERIAAADVVLVTHEVPVETVLDCLRTASDAGVRAILNPAPAHPLSADVLRIGPILTPNEHELVVAIGNDVTETALDELAARNGGPVIVTQGMAGALLADGPNRERFPGYPVANVVDTTGAGDTFNGVLAARLAEGEALPDAIRAANAAAALSIAAAGAREGMPTREAVQAILEG